MTDTNQKLREALQAISDIDDSINHAVDASAALDRIGRIARQALALPPAEQVDDINVAESFTSVTKTAAPVGERELFEHTMMDKFGWERKDFKTDGRDVYMDGYTVTAWMTWQARAALSAGDAGWQPIDTAPKDGSDCWLLVEEEVRRGFWVEIEFEERRDLDGRYIDQTDDDAYWMDKDSGDSLEPTMFYPITKPLPPAPAMRKGQL